MNIEDLKASVSRKEGENTVEQGEFQVVRVLPWPGDGVYRGTIRNIKRFETSLMIEADIYDLEMPEYYYGPKKGWIKPYTTGNDITAWFFDAFGNPTDPKDTIGKSCAVQVMKQFSTHRNMYYDNIVSFAELPADDVTEEKTKKAK